MAETMQEKIDRMRKKEDGTTEKPVTKTEQLIDENRKVEIPTIKEIAGARGKGEIPVKSYDGEEGFIDRRDELRKQAYQEMIIERVWEQYPGEQFISNKDRMALYMYFEVVNWDRTVIDMVIGNGTMQQEIIDKIGFVRLSMEVIRAKGKITFPPKALKKEVTKDEAVTN
jgi:hypothetical protein